MEENARPFPRLAVVEAESRLASVLTAEANQPSLRQPVVQPGTCRTRLQSLTCFSEFLMSERPKGTAKAITRKLLIEYLSYLPTRVCSSVRKAHALNLRNFLETAARECWLPIAAERMIFDEEIPRPSKPQPRYIPAVVLDQLNSHLGSLKAPWMQMIFILQECGMRISELLQLPLDCLTQDARRQRHGIGSARLGRA
jgi:integrase